MSARADMNADAFKKLYDEHIKPRLLLLFHGNTSTEKLGVILAIGADCRNIQTINLNALRVV